VKFFLLIFLSVMLKMQLAGAPMTDEQISARIKASSESPMDEDSATALKIWEETLAVSKATAQAVAAEQKSRDDLDKLSRLAVLAAPGAPPESTPLIDQVALSEKVSVLLESTQIKIDELTSRAKESPGLLADLTTYIARDRAKLEELEIPEPSTGKVEASRYQKALQDKRHLEAKLKQYDATQEFLRREAELSDERLRKRSEYRVALIDLQKILTARIANLKKEEAEKIRAALAESARAFADIPELAMLTSEVRELNELRSGSEGVQASLIQAKEYSDSIKETRRQTEEQYGNAVRRITLLKEAKLGIDDETGLLLRQQRASLRSTDEIADELRLNLERSAQAQLALFALTDLVKSPRDLTDKKIEELLKTHPLLERAKIQNLITRKSELLRGLRSDYSKLNDSLTKGTIAAKFTIDEIDEYSEFIDERLLWIKSTQPLNLREPLDEWSRVVVLFSPTTLGQVWDSIQANWFEKIIVSILLFLSSLVITLRRRRLRRYLKETSEQAARRNCTSIVPTIINIVAAVLLSLWLPLLVYLAATLIESPGSWHIGLSRLAVFLFLTSLLIKFSRKEGLFVSHFKMHPDRAALIQRPLRWLFPLAFPLVFLVSALTNNDGDGSTASGRIAFIIALSVGCGFIHHLFHPKRSILQKEGKGATSVTQACYVLVMAIPIVFAVGAALGYLASVLLLRGQVGASFGLLILAFLVMQFLTRWTLVSRRRLAITQVLRRREVTLAEREHAEEGTEKPADLPSLEEIKAEAVDVVEVEVQSTQLFRLVICSFVFAGLWGIWSSTLPALSFLDEVPFPGGGASTEEKVETAPLIPSLLPSMGGSVDSSEGIASQGEKVASASSDPVDDGAISLQDVLLALVFLLITFIAARNIPSLLSLTLFSSINLGPGGNFALTTTARYLIVLVGVAFALGHIGITWGKVQWLAAAITLGIGFGLQEIFANFVAGIILLFERPIRLGDVVTVGDISGKVTQIRIRATTIQQFNNRELLVPNKEFITSQLVNWTLKDSILRFEIPVGIAYGSDTKKAASVLQKILSEHPDVMDEPKPDVLFVNFGNSTLDFNVRGFVASVEHFVTAKSDLHYLIDDAFREAGIEIAFPQQDLHIRSLPEGGFNKLPS
jgi:potassium efflux system protein